MRDFIVVGAGIAGLMVAWRLQKSGVDVLIVDKSRSVPTGGSMSAGAFISPKIGKGSPLQRLTNEAFGFSWRFYRENFGDFFHQSGVLRLPKDERDCEKFQTYQHYNYPNFQLWSQNEFREAGLNLDCDIGFFFPEAGDCDAIKLCSSLAKSLEFEQMDIQEINSQGDSWELIGGNSKRVSAKNVILATGYRNSLLDMEFMGIKPLWGSRGDYLIEKGGLNFSLHRDFSISSVRDGYVKIGATHIKAKNPCSLCDGNPLKKLEAKTRELLPDAKIRQKELFCAFRSGSRDFFPVVGEIVDVEAMLRREPKITKGAKIEPIYHKNIYILNGLGGRGFLFAPYLAEILSKRVLDGVQISQTIQPDRLFWRWIRKEGKERLS